MINRFTGIGNLTQEPQSKNISNGNFVVTFSIAINDKDTVTYIDAEVWGKKAEYCLPKLKKGKPVFIDGKLRYNSWKTRDNQSRSRVYCLVDNIRILNYEINSEQNTQAKAQPKPTSNTSQKKEETFIEEDEELYSSMNDIPF
ncbi:MAG: hypothetical protein CMM25_01625 [Rhodospirillaceae bacterium]|nr:hypothetical protein [Rhodospirillaceae bacterium]